MTVQLRVDHEVTRAFIADNLAADGFTITDGCADVVIADFGGAFTITVVHHIAKPFSYPELQELLRRAGPVNETI